MDRQILDNFVAEMLKILKEAKDFTLAQAPDVFRQIVALQLVNDIVWLVFFAAVLGFGFWLKKKGHERLALGRERGSEDMSVQGAILIAAWLISLVVFTSGTMTNLLDLVKVWVAPKVYLLQFFADLIKPVATK
jgi:hypothetical protein